KDSPAAFGLRHAACAAGFVVLATMNAAGYRYAASDQAFYIPAILRHLDPALFPRDAALIDAQARLIAFDEMGAAMVRATGLSLQHLFLALYVGTLLLLYTGIAWIASRLYATRWAAVALAAALTLRHAIAKTGANTLEGYFHPRELAFALGLIAVGAFLDRRWFLIPALLVAGALFHPTTSAWFAFWLSVAAWARVPPHRSAIARAAAGIAAVLASLLLAGPLNGRLGTMDAEWLSAIGPKDLFPFDWPLNVWVTNLIALPVIALAWRARRAAGLLVSGETALVVGAFGLLGLFLCWLPFNAAHVALAVQLQLSRVFWLLDVFATVYVIWWLAEGGVGARAASTAEGARSLSTETRNAMLSAAFACAVIGFSLTRGVYSTFVEFHDRTLFAVDIQHDDWRDAMAFARSTDQASGWLADPLHAAKYGSSLRAARHRG